MPGTKSINQMNTDEQMAPCAYFSTNLFCLSWYIHFQLLPFNQHVHIYFRSVIMRLPVVIVYPFVLVASVVHKHIFTWGPAEMFFYCIKANQRSNTVRCGRGLTIHATYNYAFSIHEGNWVHWSLFLRFETILVQIVSWHRLGDKPLYEPMLVLLLTHICVTPN